MYRESPSAIIALCLSLAACTSDGTEQPTTLVDSAGVSIRTVTLPTTNEVQLLTAPSQPTLSIGTAEGDSTAQLFRVRGFTKLSSGGILVLNAGTHSVNLYGPDGARIRSSGRRGGGPSEFGFPVMLLPMQYDSAFIFDLGETRFSVIAPDGEIVRTIPAPHNLSGLTGLISADMAVTAEPQYRRDSGDHVTIVPTVVRTIDLTTGAEDTLGIVGQRHEYQYEDGELVRRVPAPFSFHPIVRVHADHIYILDDANSEIRIYGRYGRLRSVLRILAKQPRLTSTDVANYVNERTQSVPVAERTRLRRIYSSLPVPDRMPPFDDMRIDREGNLWLRSMAQPDVAYRTWTAVAPTTGVMALARVPPAMQVREISASGVLGLIVDELGVEYVQWYEWAD